MVKDINLEPPYVSRVGHFIENIHLEMGCFKSVSFAYGPHDCKTAAHILAKEVSNNNVDLCWLEETPMSVSNIVLRERFTSLYPICYDQFLSF